jgi:protocatechuate 3,4-dioxygenase beta subunit
MKPYNNTTRGRHSSSIRRIMNPRGAVLVALAMGMLIGPVPAQEIGDTCEPTRQDAMGPFYEPGAPFRSKVGDGYVLSGEVLSSGDCEPLPEAVLEFWMAGPDGNYSEEYRARLRPGAGGRYRFESHVPVPYGGRPPHIHIRVTAPGHVPLVTQHYPTEGITRTRMDLVLSEEVE